MGNSCMKTHAVSMTFLLALLLAPIGQAQTRKADLPSGGGERSRLLDAAGQDVVKKTGPHSYEVGGIRVDAGSREIRFPARVNMNEGLIEVVVCAEGGKLHESILVSSIKPIHLHVALLLLGLEPGVNPGWYVPDDPALRLPGWDRPPGDRVDVFIRRETRDGAQEVRAEALLKDERTGACLPRTSWVFTGSTLDARGVYGAHETGSIMTNYHDRLAVIDNALELGQVDDFTFANTAVIADVDTPVQVRIVPVKPQEGEKTHDK